MKKSNRLINESSPYLQQHAHNPVDWYPWGEEAFARAKKEDKAILVSIGYSTCHWCHVMERESFEDEQTAALMNEFFINIKVDREERPDIDAIYIEAVMLLQNGQAGWPLNCFLLPDGKPFFGGTYFPPQPAYKRASWTQILKNINTVFRDRREDAEKQAAQIIHHIKSTEKEFSSQINVDSQEAVFDKKYIAAAFDELETVFDTENGGFGTAPKFPGTMAVRFCLNYYLAEGDKRAINHLNFSLDKMIAGGIYDQLKGGFSRYTVDPAWLVPHFEKMLYDNALLVGLLADAYKLTKKITYKDCIIQTLDWVNDEMTSKEGLFYTALDADSEGVEGKFYVWSKEEIGSILGNKSTLFCQYYDVSAKGNWEHTNILNTPIAKEDFIKSKGLDSAEFDTFLKDSQLLLLQERKKRIRPSLDTKSLLDWNAMLITAYCKAYQALQIEDYKNKALLALSVLLDKFKLKEKGLHLLHSYHNGKAKHHAFLDDYALLITTLLEADTLVDSDKYALLAKDYCDFVCNEFLDYQDQLFFFTSAKQQDIILHKKLLHDNATPSGNATMIHNLQRVGILFDEPKYRQQALRTMSVLQKNIKKYPQSFGRWLNALFLEVYPLRTITIGTDMDASISQELQQKLLFNTFVKISKKELKGLIVCKDYTCSLPVSSVAAALDLL